jgi:hypothetical protein
MVKPPAGLPLPGGVLRPGNRHRPVGAHRALEPIFHFNLIAKLEALSIQEWL